MKKVGILIVLISLAGCRNEGEFSKKEAVANAAADKFSKITANTATEAWMAPLADATKLQSLSVPGSHDAGAFKYGGGLAVTQSADIDAQLNAGSRYLDIRISLDSASGELIVYHGIISQHLSFGDDVLPTLYAFLQNHPSEIIFLVIKNESGKDQAAWEEGVRKLVAAQPSNFLNKIGSATTVGDARGKIVLISRSGLADLATVYGGIADNVSAFAKLGDVPVYFSDRYKVATLMASDIDAKAQDIYQAINIAQNPEYENDWVTVNCNGTGLFAWPKDIASRINPKIADSLERQPKGRTGFVVIDDFNSVNGVRLAQDVIDRNF